MRFTTVMDIDRFLLMLDDGDSCWGTYETAFRGIIHEPQRYFPCPGLVWRGARPTLILDLEGLGPPPTFGPDIPDDHTLELPVCPTGSATVILPCGEGGLQAGVRFAEVGMNLEA